MAAQAQGSTTATILFTDLVTSTELLERAGDERASRVFQAHHRLLSDVVEAHGGSEVKWLGDGLMVAFTSSAEAVRCAIAMQQASQQPVAGERLHIRAGLHVGEALVHDGADYFGKSVVVARRLCDHGDAGQIFVSALVRDLLSGRDEFTFSDRGAVALKGLREPVAICEVLWEHDTASLLERAPFVGRAPELDVLRERLAAALAGRGSVVVLAGEPGIGKTRTAEEFCEHATMSGARVLWGRCYEGEWAPPFAPFAEAVLEYAAAASPQELSEALGDNAGVLGRVIPGLSRYLEEMGDIEPPPALAPEGERHRMLQAMGECVEAIARVRPLVLVLDDLHWADRSTVAMLQQVARSSAAQAILVLGTYRNVELDRQHPLAAALADLRREGRCERLALRGLEADEVGELVGVIAARGVPPALIEAISDETSGNPFFIREVLLHLIEEGKIAEAGGEWASELSIVEMGIPEGVREVVGRRLARLGERCNKVLRAASALRGGFTWQVLLAVAEEDEAGLLDIVDEALAAQLIVERASGTYDFTHALIRHTLYEELSTPRRALLHRQIALALEGIYADRGDEHAAEIAHHYLLGGPGGDVAKAVDWATRAATRAMSLTSYEEAAGLYERALALAEDAAIGTQVRGELLLALGHAQFCCGATDPSLAAFDEAATAARASGSSEQLARAAFGYETTRFSAAPSMWPDVARKVLALLEEAIEALGPDDSALKARLLARLGWTLRLEERERRERLAREATEMARRVGDEPTLLYVLYVAHQVLSQGAKNARARVESATEVIRVAESLRDREQELLGHYLKMHALLELGEIAAVDAGLAAFDALAAELRRPQYLSWGLVFRGMRCMMRGEFDEAERMAGEALAIERGGTQGTLALSLYGAQLFAFRREQDRLAEIRDLLVRTAAGNPAVRWSSALADMYAELGLVDEARAEFESLAADGFVGEPGDSNWMIVLTLCSETCAFLGDAERAAILHDMLAPYADQNVVVGHAPSSAGSAARYLGLLAVTMGRNDEAAAYFEQALEMNERMDSPPWVAHTSYDYASMLLRRGGPGDADLARELLADASAIAERLGMAALQRKLQVARGT